MFFINWFWKGADLVEKIENVIVKTFVIGLGVALVYIYSSMSIM